MKIRLLIFFVFFFSDLSLLCMDKNLPSDVLPKLVSISVKDGLFALEKWKVLQARSLIPCLADKKDNLKFAIPIKAMSFFSNALDMPPGNAFKKYVNLLSKKDRDLLITVAGEYDEDKNQQLNAPLLTAQLVEACLPPAVCAKIHSYVTGDDDMKTAFINSMITINSLPYKEVSSKDLIAEGLQVNHRPSRSALKRSPSDNFSNIVKIDGIEWEGRGAVAIDRERKYQLTPCQPHRFMHEWNNKEYLLWLLDNLNNVLCKTEFVCENAESLFFSSNGRYIMSHTGDKVSISSITLSDNAISISKKSTFYHNHSAQIQGICSGTACKKIVCWSFNNVQSFMSIWNGLGSIIEELKFEDAQVVQVEFNHDESRLLIRTIPVTNQSYGKQMVRIYDTSNVLKIRLLTKLSQESFEPAVYGCLGDMWMIPTGEHTMIFIRNTANGCDSKTYPTQLQGYFISRPVLAACSPDNRLFVAVIPGSLGNTITIWSALTGDIINTFHNCSENVKAIQIMADNRSLLYKIQTKKPGDYKYYKQLLYSGKDAQILEHIMKNASISEVVVFWRLLLANKNKRIVELYAEEPAHKILELPKKKTDVYEFIHKYLLRKVIDNKPVKDNRSIKRRFTSS